MSNDEIKDKCQLGMQSADAVRPIPTEHFFREQSMIISFIFTSDAYFYHWKL